ncbi:MAG: radical SAM protein [Planctomycetes bacterium]|nr:radical SAM protein [Planctomycetota bacterium]
MTAQRVYMGEFNLLMNGTTYLPLVSGILRAHAERDETVREHFAFEPFRFHIDEVDRIVDSYVDPAVATFSVSMWNAKLSLAVAERVKQRYPDCLVVFGGASVPHVPHEFLREHPAIDVAVRGEGEDAFVEILRRVGGQTRPAAVDLDDIPNTTWRTLDGETRSCKRDWPMERDLDVYPSPYLAGMYDDVFARHPELRFQAIVETNRGCPFKCTFCYWGKGGLSRKFRFHSIERVRAEIDWMADHEIRYVFNADSNFGMHRRDREIAEYLVESKQRTGFPEKFRTCYGKNTDEKIFAIGKLFHEHELEKGVTISYQSVDEGVQSNIKRDNIKLSCARELQRRFNDSGVPVYTELILGLPGESYESFVTGIDRVLSSGLENQLFIYICQIFPNTDLDAPDYRAKFGIQTRTIDLLEIHGRVRADGWIQEEEEIVVGTDAMPVEDWRRSLTLAWVTMAIHSMKLGSFVLGYLAERHGIRHSEFLRHLADGAWVGDEYPILSSELGTFRAKIDALLAGQGRGCVLPEYGDIYWDEEEACFLRISRDFDAFYDELLGLTEEFLEARGVSFGFEELSAVLRYQNLAMPRPSGRERSQVGFDWEVAEYFEALHTTEPIELRRGHEVIEAVQTLFDGDLPRFARETILWGRKSGTMLARLHRSDVRMADVASV